MKEKTTYS